MLPFEDGRLPAGERARDLLARLTVREKVGQLNQRLYGFACYERHGNRITLTKPFIEEVGRWGGLGVLYGLYRADPWSKRDFETGITEEMAARAYNTVQRYVVEHSRFGIPVLMSSECPHGHQALGGYLLPVNLAMGAAFNKGLVEEAFAVCGGQLAQAGVDLALISMLDVLRDPRWGRSEECYGEDSFLCAQLAAAAVRGCQSRNVGVVAKHFCAQGEGTGGVNASAARIGERELREIHLPPAAACCVENVVGVMAAYNEIDGLPCHANRHLLEEILRGELGFHGVVMADGTAVDRLGALTGDDMLSGALALNSGVDVSLWDEGFTRLEEAVEKGLVTEKRLDEAVFRVLLLKFERGLFEKPYLPEPICVESYTAERFPQSLELARQSLVLLKNEGGILPLKKGKIASIAVIGPNADDLYNQLGDYSPPMNPADGVTLLEGIRAQANGADVRYEQGCGIRSGDGAGIARAAELAARSDIVVLALGGSSSRFGGASFDKNGAVIARNASLQMDCGEGVDCADLSLCGLQQKLAQAVFACGKPVITVLIQGRPYAVEEIAEKTDALICAFYPGPMGGRALAELIFGKTPPSGRLPVSIPRSAAQLPVYYDYKMSYDAMRYHNEKNTPLYPFGYGLSYTRMEYGDFRLTHTEIATDALARGQAVSLALTVRNAGKIDGYAVPMLYIRGAEAGIVRRAKELKAFEKVFVKAGEKKAVRLSLTARELSVWNREMRFAAEQGRMELTLCDGDQTVWRGELKII